MREDIMITDATKLGMISVFFSPGRFSRLLTRKQELENYLGGLVMIGMATSFDLADLDFGLFRINYNVLHLKSKGADIIRFQNEICDKLKSINKEA